MSKFDSQKFCVWWLDQKSVEAILAYHMETLNQSPAYVQTEFNSRDGRAGNCRLWVALQFNDIPEVHQVDWNENGSTEKMLSDGCYGGIVLKSEDVRYVSNLPGIFTDFNLNIFNPSNGVS